MKSKVKVIKLTVSVLFFITMFIPFNLIAQSQDRQYPQETLALRLSRIAKDYKKNIVFDPGQSKETIPALNLKQADVTLALTRSLSNTSFVFKQMTDGSFVVSKDNATKKEGSSNQKGKGSLSGIVLDEKGVAIIGATVIVKGTTIGSATDADGKYTLPHIPVGTTTIQISFMSYETLQVNDVKIVAGKTTPLDVVLKESTQHLEEVVVTASYNQASATGLYAKQKNLATMSDGVSADMIKKTSDNNVAQVLKRVSGVTIDNGKYVTVRGMSERYNNVQLNGASLPSTEPNRRNFAFDVIPSGLVDNVTISKTFTPDMPGEFTGGLVEVNTLAVPDEKFLSLGIGTGMNTISTGKKFYSTKRFGSDWFFGEIDKRKWYSGGDEAATALNIINAGQKNTYGLRKYTAMPLQNYSLTAGSPFNLGRSSLGVVAALTYRHEENTEEIIEGNMITRDSIFKPSGKGSYRYKAATSIGAVLNTGWRMGGHSITWRNLFNNRFNHTNQQRFINKYYEDQKLVEQYSVPLVSSLWQTQLDGKHNLFGGKLIASWNASYNDIARTNPDDRMAQGAIVGESPDGVSFVNWGWATDYGNSFNVGSGHIMYSKLHETKKNIGVNLEHPFIIQGNRQSIKIGYLGAFRRADFEQQYLKAMKAKIDNSINSLPIEEFYAPQHFGSNPLIYELSGMQGTKADYYEGGQDIHSTYLMGDFSFLRKLRLIGGLRMEKTDMHVTTEMLEKTIGGGMIDSTTVIKKTDWLPAATLIYSITPELNARASYSKTLARPDFRELSQSSYYNVDDRVWVINGSGIEQSRIHNYDVRVEWYPRPGEVLSVSYFHKKFIKPVEMVMRMLSDMQNFEMYNMNLDNSTAKGVELNWRKGLGFISPSLRDLYFTGNYTWMKANVKYNQEKLLNPNIKDSDPDFDRDRPLQGLSPYTLNLGLAYEGNIIGAAVNYNRNGRKLVYAGEETKYDQYENSRDVLDLQFSTRLMKDQRLELKFNISDIFNQDIIVYRNTRIVEYTAENPDPETGKSGTVYMDLTGDMNYNKGDYVMSRIKKGINLSLSASYKF
ncbi:outer membrane receptor protein involved in Fe transport [Dysgonomonas hofstadii]|uniref:Outer membrane receptor protein involved in Fe transport n=1 Tax=Dysgonomonas hofstadii TaxID=637886 RepID=A0A840CFM4_9BACT|nr:TonB-dependent receptor [Dysgonomonas hofstadii]MBB4034797.1 outer membrane receptor protein involved in Fe transport [Dysgonomonas hofstadii]